MEHARAKNSEAVVNLASPTKPLSQKQDELALFWEKDFRLSFPFAEILL